MKTFITIQHTQSVHHTNGMVGSWTDWELSELGHAQAEKIGEKLKFELAGRTFVMYSSDLLRAKQTAEHVGKYNPCVSWGFAQRVQCDVFRTGCGGNEHL